MRPHARGKWEMGNTGEDFSLSLSLCISLFPFPFPCMRGGVHERVSIPIPDWEGYRTTGWKPALEGTYRGHLPRKGRMQDANPQQGVNNTPFTLTLHKPFSTFDSDGQPKPIPYLIDGLLPERAFSVLAGKPKQGKSSLARYQAVCVLKAQPFLGRDTKRGEVMLISLEDPRHHIDNCLAALGYDENVDAMIHIVDQLAPRIDESIDAIETAIKENPAIRLVIIDTLAKLLRVGDQNDYSQVLNSISKISALARRHPHLHVQGLAHCKKVKTDDLFDSLLGSTALRGETDTNILLYNDGGKRVIAAETRIGRSVEPTLIDANMVVRAAAEVVSGYSLDVPLERWQKARADKAERQETITREQRVIDFLQQQPDKSAKQRDVLKAVGGKGELALKAIKDLIPKNVITAKGKPLTLHLNEAALPVYQITSAFGADGGGDE